MLFVCGVTKGKIENGLVIHRYSSHRSTTDYERTYVAIVLATSQVPDQDSLVAGGREDEVGVVGVCGDGCHPAAVALLYDESE